MNYFNYNNNLIKGTLVESATSASYYLVTKDSIPDFDSNKDGFFSKGTLLGSNKKGVNIYHVGYSTVARKFKKISSVEYKTKKESN